MANSKIIEWQALEHTHVERSADWYWIIWIIALGIVVLSIFFKNFLLALIIILATTIAQVRSKIEPQLITFKITRKGVVAGHTIYPFSELESFWVVDDEDDLYDKIIFRSKKSFMPFLILPYDSDTLNPDELRDYLLDYLDEEHLEEPVSQKVMEYFGF